MSLVTVSTKRHRVYHRLFDHEEAQRLRAEGWSYQRLAEHFGVTDLAVRRVCDSAVNERMQAYSREYVRKKREPCKGGCGRLVWPHSSSGYCLPCFKAREVSPDVRDGELRCTRCRVWKPDSDYPTGSGSSKARRGHSSRCRACQTAVRREYRQTHPEQTKRENRRAVEMRRQKEVRLARYIVFQPNGAGFVEIARVDAGSPAHAVEQVAAAEGDYVAVAEGRFRIMRVAPVQAFRVVPSDEAGAEDPAKLKNGAERSDLQR